MIFALMMTIFLYISMHFCFNHCWKRTLHHPATYACELFCHAIFIKRRWKCIDWCAVHGKMVMKIVVWVEILSSGKIVGRMTIFVRKMWAKVDNSAKLPIHVLHVKTWRKSILYEQTEAKWPFVVNGSGNIRKFIAWCICFSWKTITCLLHAFSSIIHFQCYSWNVVLPFSANIHIHLCCPFIVSTHLQSRKKQLYFPSFSITFSPSIL